MDGVLKELDDAKGVQFYSVRLLKVFGGLSIMSFCFFSKVSVFSLFF